MTASRQRPTGDDLPAKGRAAGHAWPPRCMAAGHHPSGRQHDHPQPQTRCQPVPLSPDPAGHSIGPRRMTNTPCTTGAARRPREWIRAIVRSPSRRCRTAVPVGAPAEDTPHCIFQPVAQNISACCTNGSRGKRSPRRRQQGFAYGVVAPLSNREADVGSTRPHRSSTGRLCATG